MVTTKIEIKQHLAEYLQGKYNNCSPGPVSLPSGDDLYHIVYDLLEKCPAGCMPSGNVELIVPHRHIGKNPEVYNYLGIRSSSIISQKIENLFWAELHCMIDENKHSKGIQYIESVTFFLHQYGIQAISEDALLKNYYRWRKNVREKAKRRQYTKRVKHC